jgi:hypothetical protein
MCIPLPSVNYLVFGVHVNLLHLLLDEDIGKPVRLQIFLVVHSRYVMHKVKHELNCYCIQIACVVRKKPRNTSLQDFGTKPLGKRPHLVGQVNLSERIM